MRVRYVKSACVVVEHAGVRVLCDPWLTDGIYYGSWYHYPPLDVEPEDFRGVDYVYVSHVHPDHLDVETLRRLDPETPVLIHDYRDKFVRRILESVGFEQIVELRHDELMPLSDDLAIEILAADNCDPSLCGKHFGCDALTTDGRTRQIDSLAVFRGGGRTLVNVNDSPYALAAAVCDKIRARHDAVDMLLTGYAGAGPYPQCFDNLDLDRKHERARAKRNQFLDQAMRFIEHLEPRWAMPFAGQYVLGGKLASLNPLRGVPETEELAALFAPRLATLASPPELVQLDSGEFFDLETGEASAPFHPPDPEARQRYVMQELAERRFPYEAELRIPDDERIDLTQRLEQARTRMHRHQEDFGFRSDWTIYLRTGQEHDYRVPLDGSPVSRVAPGEHREPYVRIELDYSLLTMILDRKAHWNNAEIGSHLRFYRQPDHYERAVFFFLSFLHG